MTNNALTVGSGVCAGCFRRFSCALACLIWLAIIWQLKSPTIADGATDREIEMVRDDVIALHLIVWDQWAEWAKTPAAGVPDRDTSAAIAEVKRSFDAVDRPGAARALSRVLDCRPGADDEKSLHLQAAFTLTVIGGADATEGLKKAVRDKDLAVSLAGVGGLRRQPDDAAIDSLTNVLEAGRVEHADVVLNNLAQMHIQRKQLAVAALLLGDDRSAVRVRAAELLQAGGTRAREFAPQVLRAIDKEPGEGRAALIDCLTSIVPDVPATKVVVQRHLRSRSSSVREAAVNGAARLEVPKQDLEDDVADIALHDTDEFVRRHAIAALGGFQLPSARTVDILTRYLDDNDDLVLRAAMGSLGRLRAAGRPALPKLTEILQNATRAGTRECAAKAIGEIGSAPPAVQTALTHSLTDGEASVREAAATALGCVDSPGQGALLALRHSMRDPNLAVVVAATLAVWRIDRDAAAAVHALISVMDLAGKDDAVFSCSLDALAAMGPAARAACPRAARCLTHQSEQVRVSALKFLAVAPIRDMPAR